MAAKNKANRARKVKKNDPKQGSRARKSRLQATIGRLDASAAQFARLLSDPCNASLCHPVYSGSDVGYLGRYEVDFVLSPFTNVASTAGAVLFAPGCIGVSAENTAASSGINSFMMKGLNTDTVTDSSNLQWFTRSTNSTQPGQSFFAFGSEAVRPVAACLQVHYTGTELNRAGTVSLARVNAGAALNTDSDTIAELRAMSQYVDRTPQSHYEIVWTPADGDQLFTDPSLITGQRQAERKNAIMATFSGVSPSDIRIRMVVVYEWVPEPGQGLVVDSSSRNKSNNSLDHVLNALDSAGKWWIRNERTIGAVYKFGAMMLGGA